MYEQTTDPGGSRKQRSSLDELGSLHFAHKKQVSLVSPSSSVIVCVYTLACLLHRQRQLGVSGCVHVLVHELQVLISEEHELQSERSCPV